MEKIHFPIVTNESQGGKQLAKTFNLKFKKSRIVESPSLLLPLLCVTINLFVITSIIQLHAFCYSTPCTLFNNSLRMGNSS